MLTLKFSCRITPNGSMKAADLLNTLNQHFGMQLPVEKADITRLDLYRAAADGRRLPMLEHMDKFIQQFRKGGAFVWKPKSLSVLRQKKHVWV